ncbi:MAG: hydroxyethylthiazole kinase [Coriobacteriales bacterium]|nr:hydroxyethylthiazole kinase [Coriobacteriales bacterium]
MELAPFHLAVARRVPLIHNITNYVTVNDVANILLAAGASPIMADEPQEAAEITSICDALVINIGTLNCQTIPAMQLAGATANKLGHPLVLDPVGAGASSLRTNTARELLEALRFTVIRGNSSEIKTLFAGDGSTRGVDASDLDAVGEQGLEALAEVARRFAARTGAVVAITGVIDIVAGPDGRAFAVRNGHAMMARITGSGCMLSALVAAFVVANPEAALEATLAAVATMGVAGELAYERVSGSTAGAGDGAAVATGGGTASFRSALIDAIGQLDGAALDARANVEELR